jgi:hypothetical protein
VQDPGGFVISNAQRSQYSPSVTSNDSIYLVAWHDNRVNGKWLDIYAARVTGAGLSVIVTLFVTPLYVALTLAVVWEVTADALAENRIWLDPVEVFDLLAAYAIPATPVVVAKDPDQVRFVCFCRHPQ